MKYFRFLVIALCAAVFVSCGNNNGNNVTSNAQQPSATDSNANVAVQTPSQDAPQAAPAPQAGVPEAVASFITGNFSGATITGSNRDDDGEFEVYLNDGTKVEFDPSNQWETITCPGKAVPAAFVSGKISSYVKSNYQSALITKIDKKRTGGYEIELNNGVELNFAADGSFLGVDD